MTEEQRNTLAALLSKIEGSCDDGDVMTIFQSVREARELLGIDHWSRGASAGLAAVICGECQVVVGHAPHCSKSVQDGENGQSSAPERYPLWCIDNGDRTDDRRYTLVEGDDASRQRAAESAGGTLRRCRRILASEIDGSPDLGSVIESIDESATDGGTPVGAWASWDDPLAVASQHAPEAFDRWLDEHVTIEAWICEGDEKPETSTT